MYYWLYEVTSYKLYNVCVLNGIWCSIFYQSLRLQVAGFWLMNDDATTKYVHLHLLLLTSSSKNVHWTYYAAGTLHQKESKPIISIVLYFFPFCYVTSITFAREGTFFYAYIIFFVNQTYHVYLKNGYIFLHWIYILSMYVMHILCMCSVFSVLLPFLLSVSVEQCQKKAREYFLSSSLSCRCNL